MGPLKIIPGGIQLRGESMVLDNLIASKIRSRKGQPIHIESSKNITLLARGTDGRVLNKLFLGMSNYPIFTLICKKITLQFFAQNLRRRQTRMSSIPNEDNGYTRPSLVLCRSQRSLGWCWTTSCHRFGAYHTYILDKDGNRKGCMCHYPVCELS